MDDKDQEFEVGVIVYCPWCGQAPRAGETHGVIGEMDPHSDDLPVRCTLIRICRNPRRLGVITGITGDGD